MSPGQPSPPCSAGSGPEFPPCRERDSGFHLHGCAQVPIRWPCSPQRGSFGVPKYLLTPHTHTPPLPPSTGPWARRPCVEWSWPRTLMGMGAKPGGHPHPRSALPCTWPCAPRAGPAPPAAPTRQATLNPGWQTQGLRTPPSRSHLPAALPLPLWVGAGSAPSPRARLCLPASLGPDVAGTGQQGAPGSPRACLPAGPVLGPCWGETPQPQSSKTPGRLFLATLARVRPADVPTATTQAQMGAVALWRCHGAPRRAPRLGGDPSGPCLSLQGRQGGSSPQVGYPSHMPWAGATQTGQEGVGGLHREVGGTWTLRGHRMGSCVADPSGARGAGRLGEGAGVGEGL